MRWPSHQEICATLLPYVGKAAAEVTQLEVARVLDVKFGPVWRDNYEISLSVDSDFVPGERGVAVGFEVKFK